MPGIFRKRKNRRHTADNADETRAAVRAARKSVSKEDVHANDYVFVNNTKAKPQYKGQHVQVNVGSEDSTSNTSSQANGCVFTPSSLPRSRSETSNMSDRGTAKTTHRSSAMSLHSDILFLRWKGEVKRAPTPSPLTMATLKSLFVAMFGVEVAVKQDPHWVVFMQDAATEEWVPVFSTDSIPSRPLLTLQHCDKPPTPPPGPLSTSKLSSSNPAFPGEMHHALTRRPSSHLRRGSAGLQRIPSAGVPAENGHASSDEVAGTDDSIEHGFKDVVNRVSSPEQRLIELEASILQENLDTTWALQWSANPNDKSLRGRAATLQLSVHHLQKDLKKLRVEQRNQLQLFQHNLQQSCDVILAKLRHHREMEGVAHLVPSQAGFRRKRLELEPEEETYLKHSGQLYEEFRMLDEWVEELRVDVSQRRCKVVPSEIHVLSESVAMLSRGLLELQKRHGPLVKRLKTVMEKELEVIVREERFVGEEETRVASTISRCEKMEETLLNLRKVASVQHHRSPTIPFVMADIEPDRHALLDSIQTVIPDHAQRMQRIQLSEEARIKKKELLQPKGPKLADKILQNQSKMLKKTDYVTEAETRHHTHIMSMYNEEKREKDEAEERRKEEVRRAEEEKRAREQFILEQKRKEEEDRKKFNEQCRLFNMRRREREQKLEEFRRMEENWQRKEAQRANIKQLSEQERLEEWRRREQLRIQGEQRNKQNAPPMGQRSGSQSSPENSGPIPPPMGGPPPYSGPTNRMANPESMFNMLMMPSGPPPSHGAKRTVTLVDAGRPQVHPVPSHARKVVHNRSQSSDSKARELERRANAAQAHGHTTMTALHLENQSKHGPPPPTAAGAQRGGGYSWLPQGMKTRSNVGSYYSDQLLEPVKRAEIPRRRSNPNKRDRSDPHRHSVGAEVVLQPAENGPVGGLTGNPARLAQSTEMTRLPMATGAPPPPQPITHVSSVPKQPQPTAVVTKAPPVNRTAARSNGVPKDTSVYSSFV